LTRREFPTRVRAAAIKRATDAKGIVRCEKCKGEAKAPEVDHINPDGLTGEPTISNAMVMCALCHLAKSKQDTANIAEAKRREAKHIGAKTPSPRPLKSRNTFPAGRTRSAKESLPPRALYRDATQ
jgi:5-methylcytosine-specific restriction protein A